MVYRNIYFKKNILQNGNGTVDVQYTGCLYSNCETIKNFRQQFDKNLDLYISCTDCASNKYRRFIKVSYS